VLARRNRANHYPHAHTEENRQGLHYSGFSEPIHKPAIDYQADYSATTAKSRPNPLSWGKGQKKNPAKRQGKRHMAQEE
jgi:hypothetical protein